MLSKASLTAGNPEGDVMWGVDNTFLSRAVADGVFEPYDSPAVGEHPAELTELVPNGEATPVDYGDVCVNYDVAWFADNGLDVPTSLDDLIDPAYADLLVVQNPATSSPGLAFLLATIDEYGDEPDDSGIPGWQAYWQSLVDNGVEVVDGWTQAYYERFSAAGGGPKPLVVSYGIEPARRDHLRRPRDRRDRVDLLPSGRVRRASSAAPTSPTRRSSSSTSWSANGSSPSSRSTCSSIRPTPTSNCRRSSSKPRSSRPTRTRSIRPTSTPTAAPGSTSGRSW